MEHAVVYVFLLDNLTALSNAFNETLILNTPNINSNFTPVIRQCDPTTSNQILNAVSQELDLADARKDTLNEDSQEIYFNSLLSTKDKKNDDFYEKDIDSFNFDSETYQEEHIASSSVNISRKIWRSVSFVVAIFETLSNVTAQTCAGAMLSPRWVLTAANCVNILKSLYANNTNMAHQQTLYTVVAGATDPLSDGSVYNVTKLLVNQESSGNRSRNGLVGQLDIGPHLAMLRIEPEFEGAGLPLVENIVTKGDVLIYGWVLSKNVSEVDVMNLVTVSARILTTAECQAMYSYINMEVICLFNNDKERNITLLSSGGPVLMLQGGEERLLAVAHTDEDLLIAYPLHVHLEEIKKVLHNKVM